MEIKVKDFDRAYFTIKDILSGQHDLNIPTDSPFGKNNPMYGRTGECAPSSKLVLDTFTGIYYISCKEAAETIGISYKRLVRYLNGTRKNKTNLIYV